jgi:hypothetical protein
MGHQVAAALSEAQELEMLGFVRRSKSVVLLHAYPLRASELEVEEFAPRSDWNWFYYLWNTEFPWAPDVKYEESSGRFHIANTACAPLVEYTRHNFLAPEPIGRLYWASGFAATSPLPYDTAAFGKWFSSLARWVARRAAP